MKRFLIRQGQKRLQLIRQLPVEQYIPILGYKDKIPKEMLEGAFLKYSKHYLQGDYGIALSLETMKAQEDAKDRAELKDMMATVVQASPQLEKEGKRVKISKLLEDWLNKYNKFETDDYIEDMNLRTADEEALGYLMMAQTGQIVPILPQDGEDLEEHLQKHVEFAKSPLKSQMPKEVFEALLNHIGKTEEIIKQKQQRLRQATQTKG